MEVRGPRPVPVRHRFEAADAGVAQLAFDAPADAGVHFGLREGFEQDDGTPPLLRRPGDEIVEVVGGVREAQPAQIIGQGRRRGRGD